MDILFDDVSLFRVGMFHIFYVILCTIIIYNAVFLWFNVCLFLFMFFFYVFFLLYFFFRI